MESTNSHTAIEEFENLLNYGFINMSKIEWWLLKHSNNYRKTHDFAYSQHLFTNDDGSVIQLPPLGKPTDEEKFLDLYNSLDTLSEFQRNEKYFEQEMLNYHKIKNSHSDLKNWVAKNEEFGADRYLCFLIDYLDYDENDEEEHLKVFLLKSKELEIYVDRQDFKNTIDFLEIFNELYWVQEILPESMERIRIEMKKSSR